MACRTFQGDGFTAIICGSKPRAKKCHYCARPSDVLCDHPAGIGKTCDRPCCRAHAEHVGEDRDYCLTHAEFDRKKKEEQVAEPNLPTIEKRMATLLMLIAEEVRPCKGCGQQLAFVKHKNGKLAPYTIEGLNHFLDCPKAEEFRRQKAAARG